MPHFERSCKQGEGPVCTYMCNGEVSKAALEMPALLRCTCLGAGPAAAWGPPLSLVSATWKATRAGRCLPLQASLEITDVSQFMHLVCGSSSQQGADPPTVWDLPSPLAGAV